MGGHTLFVNGFSFLLAFLLAYLITPIIKKYSNGNGYVDNPDERKVHSAAIPRLGGIAIYAAFIIPVIAVLHLQYIDSTEVNSLWGFLLGGTIIFALGVYDDLKGANAWQKFSVQIIVSVILYFNGFRIDILTNPLGGAFQLDWLSMPVTVLWIVGITNAFNLIDGIDGLAAGVSVMVCMTLISLSIFLGNPLVIFLALALGGAVLGFIPYNRNPASIFMGDSGSLFLGFTIACLAIWGSQKSHVTVSILVPIIALGFPIMDTLLAIFRRFLKKAPLFDADMEHCHHKLLEKGYSPKKALNILYILCAFFSSAAFLLALVSNLGATVILSLVIAVTFSFMHILGYFDYIPARKINHELIEKPIIQQLDTGV